MTAAVLLVCASLAAIDGDTLICDAETIRLANIDAPEVHSAKCPEERLAGYRAALRLDELLKDPSTIAREGKDRYGRTLARISAGGRDLGAVLIEEGHARPWLGRREAWCAAK